MCGYGDKVDRRPIDPPPIIQLILPEHFHSSSPNFTPQTLHELQQLKEKVLTNPYYFMYASLIDYQTDEEVYLLKDGKTRATTGLYRLKDVDNNDGGFFVFPDLSVRTEGSYRLKFSLFETKDEKVKFLQSVYSEVFHVYTAKKFPGMEESTVLSKSFAEQGLKIRIRKEIRQKKNKSRSNSKLASPNAAEANTPDSESFRQTPPFPESQSQFEFYNSTSASLASDYNRQHATNLRYKPYPLPQQPKYHASMTAASHVNSNHQSSVNGIKQNGQSAQSSNETLQESAVEGSSTETMKLKHLID